MKVAIIGSRSIKDCDIEKYMPHGVTEIVSGGAAGVDTCAAEYAKMKGINLTEFLPQYERYRRGAPLIRNTQIITYADKVIAFWDGKSKGTKFAIEKCRKMNKDITVVRL